MLSKNQKDNFLKQHPNNISTKTSLTPQENKWNRFSLNANEWPKKWLKSDKWVSFNVCAHLIIVTHYRTVFSFGSFLLFCTKTFLRQSLTFFSKAYAFISLTKFDSISFCGVQKIIDFSGSVLRFSLDCTVSE